LRRLYSTFAHGLPGAGLLLMRAVAGSALVFHEVMALRGGAVTGAAILHVLGAGAGTLLVVGLWTPVAGSVVTLIELWNIPSQAGDPSIPILLGTFGAALALLGPGGWSVDARLFGWKRIDFQDRKS
jgi:putative oxidoreductase